MNKADGPCNQGAHSLERKTNINRETKTIKTNNQEPSAGGVGHEENHSVVGEIRAALSGRGKETFERDTKNEKSVP